MVMFSQRAQNGLPKNQSRNAKRSKANSKRRLSFSKRAAIFPDATPPVQQLPDE
jgi:hypothetical protein